MNAKKLARIGAIAGAMTVGGLTFGLLNPLVPASAQDTTAPTAQSATPDGNRPEHGERRMGGKPNSAAVASVLGMTEEEVRTAHQEGKTLAALASEKGVDVQKVIDALVADASTHLDQAVTDGKLTQAEADAKKAELPAKVTERVNSTRPAGDRGPGGPGGGDRGMGAKPNSAAVASVLGMTEEEVHTARHEGKTLAALASEKGVDVQKVIDALVADASTHLDQAVTDGKLTQAEADAKKAELPAKVTERVNSTRPAGDRGPGGHRGDRGATPPAEAGSTPTTPA